MSPLLSPFFPFWLNVERTDNRWHETQAVYSCDFQPLPLAQLKRLLSEDDDPSKEKERAGSSSTGPIIAGGRQYRLATGGGDSKVRVSPFLSAGGRDTRCSRELMVVMDGSS
jgi:hypothetical protein